MTTPKPESKIAENIEDIYFFFSQDSAVTITRIPLKSHLSVCLAFYMSIYLSVYLSVRHFLCHYFVRVFSSMFSF